MKKSGFRAFVVAVMAFAAVVAGAQSNAQSGEPAVTVEGAVARVEQARQLGVDFECPGYFPSEWEAAEAAAVAAQGAATGDIDALNAAADAYEGIFSRAIPLYAQAREDEIMDARGGVVASGFASAFPAFFSPADQTALRALSEYEGGDYYAARDSAAAALLMYQTLSVSAECWLVRQEIIDRAFEPYDHEEFEKADALTAVVLDQYKAGDYAAAQDSAGQALSIYRQTLQTGWVGFSAHCAASAATERQAAVDVKADVAAREMFNNAEGVYQEAMGMAALAASASADDDADVAAAAIPLYEAAAAAFTDAEALFIMASMTTSEKRLAAVDALREADARTAQAAERGGQPEEWLEEGQRLTKLAHETYDYGDYDTAAAFAWEAVQYARLAEFDGVVPDDVDGGVAGGGSSAPAGGVAGGGSSAPAGGTVASGGSSAPAGGSSTPAVTPAASASDSGLAPLPAQYTVRTWIDYKDCLWNIAGYPWAYGDPEQWRRLYDANRSKMPDPDDPNLLEPGLVLDIPSIKGETRQGMWTSGQTYQSF